MPDYTDLWSFECRLDHGEFDVWGIDWSQVDKLDRPQYARDGTFEPEDVTASRCPQCLVTGIPVGPRQSLA